MDLEHDVQINLSTEQLTDIVRTFKEEVTKAGFGFGLYMGKYNFEQGEVSLPLLGETHVWLARYYDGYKVKTFGETPNENYKPVVKNGSLWGWQWTSSGRVDGISGNVDVNEAYYEITAKGATNEEAGDASTDDAITEIAKDVIAGKYGNGHENRKEAIYEGVRKKVNEILG